MFSFFQQSSIYLGLCCLGFSSLFANANNLQESYELALKHEASLKSAHANFKAQQEVEKSAVAALLPQISVGANISRTDSDQKEISAINQQRTARDQNITSRNWNLTLDQQLINMASWYNYKSGKLISQKATADYISQQQNLMVKVAEAYFNVLRAQDNLQAAKSEETALNRQFEQTQERFEVGLIAITDVHESRAALDNSRVLSLSFQDQLGIALEELYILTGVKYDQIWTLKKNFPITSPDPSDQQAWVDAALANNPMLKSANLQSAAANETARAKKMQLMPSLSARINVQNSDTDGNFKQAGTRFDIDNESDQNTVSLNLNAPIFLGGYNHSQRRQAYHQAHASKYHALDMQRQIIKNIRSLHLAATTDVKRVAARDRGIISTMSALEATQAGYEVGTRNIVDVLQSQRSLYAALRDHANARYDYVLNMLRLKQQAGTLNPEDLNSLNKWLEQPSVARASKY